MQSLLISYGNETLLTQPKSLKVIFASLMGLFNGQVPEGNCDQTPVTLHRFGVHLQNKDVTWADKAEVSKIFSIENQGSEPAVNLFFFSEGVQDALKPLLGEACVHHVVGNEQAVTFV